MLAPRTEQKIFEHAVPTKAFDPSKREFNMSGRTSIACVLRKPHAVLRFVTPGEGYELLCFSIR